MLKNKYVKYGGGAVVVLFVGFILWDLYGPRWGSMYYGVCKVFAERYIDYPDTLKVRQLEYYNISARLTVSHHDAAGQFRNDVFECEYGGEGYNITRVRINRQVLSSLNESEPVNPQILEEFNAGLPAINAYPPDLILPRFKTGGLNDLWQGEE